MSRLRGTVTKIVGTSSEVQTPRGAYRCDLRARLFRRSKVRLAVGDEVLLEERVAPGEDGTPGRGVIEELCPRRTVLRRTRDFKRDQVLCANLDQVVLVVAVLDPPYKRSFMDRVLVGVERDGLAAVVVFNKRDLADEEYLEVIEEDAGVYAGLGYRVLLVSAREGTGLEELREVFHGKVSAVVGPSGVGKSTLLNAVQPGLRLRTGEVSAQDGRGRHTTTAAELVRLDGGGYVVDTPGLRGFGLWDLGPEEVAAGFREIAALRGACRFADCRHRAEPDCAVRAAVEAGEVDSERFESYLRLLEDSEARAAERQAARRR